jgi:uncharacterized membrane protein YfcA
MTALDAFSTPALLAGAGAILVAALLRGFTGFGFALASVPLATLALPPRVVVPAILVIQAAIGLHDCVVEFRRADWRVVAGLVAGSLFGTPLGVLALTALPQPTVRLALGVVVMAAVIATWRPRPAATGDIAAPGIRRRTRLSVLAGFASGVCNGLAAMSGPPAILYFMHYEPRHTVMRSSLMVFFPIASAIALPMVYASGLLGWPSVALAVGGLPLMMAGGWIGAIGFRRYGGAAYRPAAGAALLVTAAIAIAKGLAEMG